MAIHSVPRPAFATYYTRPEFEQKKDSQGNSLRDQQDEYTFAKRLSDSLGKSMTSNRMSYSYYIRVDGQRICDPRKIFSIQETKTNYIDRVCRGEDIWTKVPQSAFEKYLKFLQTDSDQWLKEAMRDSK